MIAIQVKVEAIKRTEDYIEQVVSILNRACSTGINYILVQGLKDNTKLIKSGWYINQKSNQQHWCTCKHWFQLSAVVVNWVIVAYFLQGYNL